MLIDIEELANSYIAYPLNYKHPRIWYRYDTVDGEHQAHLYSFKTLLEFYSWLIEVHLSTLYNFDEYIELIKTRVISFNKNTTITISENITDDGFLCKIWLNACENEIDKERYDDYQKYRYRHGYNLKNVDRLDKLWVKSN